MTSQTENLWDIQALPFLYEPLERPTNPHGVPDALPFHLGLDTTTGRLM